MSLFLAGGTVLFVSGASAQEASASAGAESKSGVLQAKASVDKSDGEKRRNSFRVHGMLGLAKAVSGYQQREFGWGSGITAAAEWGPSALWGIQAEAGFVALGGVDKVAPDGLAELGPSAGGHLALGVRLRPLAGPGGDYPSGPWLSASGGVSLTGGQAAPLFDTFLGYDFSLGPNLGLGPTLGYLLVVQTRDVPRSDNAHLVLAGLHGSFDFGAPPAKNSDRDLDGLLDSLDACPDDPEDRDGFEDEDGCPELDNDKDGLFDPADHCPLDPEDIDEFEDDDGCPDPDNDQDQVLDEQDKCPLQPEDQDEFEDEDGCPDPDNDQDKILDEKDLCPNEPEVRNGIADNDGCPDSESVRVVGDKIELDQKIHFWTNSDRIRAMSYPVLHKLAGFLKEHVEYVHIDIEGHADQRGEAAFNLDLSQRRARAILEFLAKRGLAESRLSSQGFGSERPLVEGNDEHSWFMNRRVEFVVTRNRQVRVNAATGEEIGGAIQGDDVPAFGRDHDAAEESSP